MLSRERLRLRQEALRQQKAVAGGTVVEPAPVVEATANISMISTTSSVAAKVIRNDSSFNDASVSSSNVSMTDDSFESSTMSSSFQESFSTAKKASMNDTMSSIPSRKSNNNDSNAVMSFEELDDSYDG